MPKIRSTSDGLIYVKSSLIENLKRPNALEGAKALGKPVIINADHIGFLSYNNDGRVTFFMTNGFEISINVFFDEAEIIFNCAKGGIEKEIL
ncbi:hypothetical protein ASG31_05350 [Chryseobacterium sp. Leaf404]|uniref:hypothetical protein n=1 Tax=unclassified Chryseobacterium TaxID=2593645 RepID=UPI0006FF0ADD|nr:MULTISPECIES: hypothetical protein [unclassified Chryseobacterium]KQT18160.1 hypothetical protein ASG31_05350 [Chryseobacterium sp. Leaf404]